jgi:RNA polymerase primary sigma factor
MTDATAELNTPVAPGEDDVRRYMEEIRHFPMLTPQQELALAKRCAEGDQNAVREMVNANLRLVVSVAREYAGRGVPLLDLIQEGSIGLLVAARKFDYTLEYRFSTYATKWIRQGVTRCLQNHTGLIRVPAHTGERLRKVLQAKALLLQLTGKEPTIGEIAQHCDISEERARYLLNLNPETCSLDAPAGEEGENTLGGLLEDQLSPQPEEQLVREELNRTMENLMSMLTERQRMVLRLHFGMEDCICHSLENISIRFGVSKERVRQIERQAMERLQKLGANIGLEDFLK